MNPKISAYIFDLDGTLLDTENVWVNTTMDYLHGKECPVTKEEILPIVYGRSWTDVYADIVKMFPQLDIGLPEMQKEMAVCFYKHRTPESIKISSSIDLLKRLSKDFPCCIVSGSPREHIAEAIEIMEAEDCLAFYLGASDYPFGKPHPSGFLMAAEKLNVPPNQCVVFEDSNVGVTAAKAAGMKVVALALPLHPKQDVGLADIILPDLSMFSPDMLQS